MEAHRGSNVEDSTLTGSSSQLPCYFICYFMGVIELVAAFLMCKLSEFGRRQPAFAGQTFRIAGLS